MIAEFIGTCVLVVFGCGTAMTVGCDSTSGYGYILTALAFGLVIVAPLVGGVIAALVYRLIAPKEQEA